MFDMLVPVAGRIGSDQGFRWRLAEDDGGQPSLFSDEELYDRHVGIGEYRGLEFLHVNAKRIINPVPASSHMGFRFTINAYRGCSHSCAYCASGDTAVHMASGDTKPIGDLRAGEKVIGTTQSRGNRVYVETTVLDHWSTEQAAYRVVLDDSTQLITSRDHRFLTTGGWKNVASRKPGTSSGCSLHEGQVLLSSDVGATRTIRSISPLGITMTMYDITTGTGDFIANGVISHNCFARPTHAYLNLNIGEDFERKLIVKVNAVDKLRAELRSPRWKGDLIAMGTNTDPYQRAEGKYHLTRGIIQALGEARNPFSILTKGTLILRDLDVLTEAATRTDVRCALSIGTLDEEVWKATEPGTPHPRRRVEAVRRLNEAGIPTGVLVAPIIPGWSDSSEQLEEVATACLDAGATSVTPVVLHLRPGVKEHFLGFLDACHEALAADLRSRYGDRSYLSRRDQESITAPVRFVRPHTR